MPRYEIGVVNQTVADLVKRGQRHKHLSDDWSDIHYIEVNAEDEAAARARIKRRYPPDDGFVITSLSLVD